MVKRVVAMMVGAMAGALLWYFVAWLRAPVEAAADPVAVEHCIRNADIDCVSSDEVPAMPDAASHTTVAAPCKDWLSDDAGIAALSACLHQARREQDAVRIENFKRAQRIAASS